MLMADAGNHQIMLIGVAMFGVKLKELLNGDQREGSVFMTIASNMLVSQHGKWPVS
jgi:hypothetical protein